MQIKFQTAFAGLLLMASLTTQAAKDVSIYQRKDDFKGNTIYYTQQQQPKLEGGSFISMRYVYFNFVTLAPISEPSIAYSIKIEANLQSWIFIDDGESLVLKADDQIVPLKGPGSNSGREISSLGVQEIAYWSFSLETLKKLATAKTIQFRVYGSKGQITGTFTDRMMQELRYFAQEAPGLIKDPAALPVPNSSPATESKTPASTATPEVPPKL